MKKYLTPIGIIVAIALGIIGVSQSPVVQEKVVGASSTFVSKDLIVGDVAQRFEIVPTLNTASTTVCSITSPSSTSTLLAFSLKIDTGTSTAATIDVGTSLTSNTSTSTALFVQSDAVASGAQDTIVLPGSIPSTATSTVLAPNTKINAKTNEAGLGGYTYAGSCKAIFLVN